MSHRRAGLNSLQRHLDTSSSYSTLSTSISQSQTASLTSQLSTLQTALSTFSTTHRKHILSSPSFRAEFSTLCNELGIDPLGGGKKGVWDYLGLGDWYAALGVQIVTVCLSRRERGGGIVDLNEVIKGVESLRNGGKRESEWLESNRVSEADVRKAVKELEPLGCGYEVMELGGNAGGRRVIKCSPAGLDTDSLSLISLATSAAGSLTLPSLLSSPSLKDWAQERTVQALDNALLRDGIIWIDSQGNGEAGGEEGEQIYWVPGVFDFGS